MENDAKYIKQLEKYLIVVGIVIVVDYLFWIVFSRIASAFFPASSIGNYYRIVSLLVGIVYCGIPISAGILIKNQTWKVLLLVLGGLLFLTRITIFLFDSLNLAKLF